MVALPKQVSLFLTIGFLFLVGFVGSLHYLQQLLNPIFFIQLSLKEIFGGSRGDAKTFSYMISPVPIMTAFGIQEAGSVS